MLVSSFFNTLPQIKHRKTNLQPIRLISFNQKNDMANMQALVLVENEKIALQSMPIPELKEGEALVKIKAAALNHRDQWCRIGMYPGLKYPSILGSDGCGTVEKVYNDADQAWLGKEVIMNPNVNWGDDPRFQSFNYSILGMPTNGTLAEYVVVPTHRLHEKPSHLSPAQASALPLAALTAYRAVFTKGEAKPEHKVLVTGIGGGVSQFAFQFAKALGCKVFVTSGSDEKLEKMKAAGADGVANYKEEKWEKNLVKQASGNFDVIIDSGGGKGFEALAKSLNLAGTLVVYGGTAGTKVTLQLPRFWFAQANIKGSTMGNDQEFAEMVKFVNEHKIAPMISSTRPFDQVVSAFDEMHEGKQFGKLVIEI